MSSSERSRQYKILLSDLEWEKLVDIAETDDACASEVLRAFIHRRHDELERLEAQGLSVVADELVALARRPRALAARSSRGR